MIFATILTLCTALSAPCNSYIVDTATTAKDAATNKAVQSSEVHIAWMNDASLADYLSKHKISESLAEIQSYEISNQIIEENDIP